MASVHLIEEMRTKRAGLFERMSEINDSAEAEGRDLSSEERQEYDRVEGEFDSLTERIARAEKLRGMEAGLSVPKRADEPVDVEERSVPASLNEFLESRQGQRPQDTDEYRQAFYRWMTVRDLRELTGEESRALSKATAAAGANLVPTDFSRQLIDALRDFGVVRQIANVITTDNGEALSLPSVSSHGTASWTAENAAYSESDEAFGTATLNAWKAATLMRISEELLTDSAFDLEGYTRVEFGQRIGVLENTAYTVGDGTSKPAGWNNNATVGVTAATGNTTTIPADNIIDLIHSVSPPYRRGAVFVGNDQSVKALRRLKDTTNQYLWQPGLTAGAPDSLLGYPVYSDPDVPAPAANARSLGFGNFRLGYTIRDVNGVMFQRLNELYAANGQVGFRAYHRTDGKITNANAIRVFVHSAT